MQELLRGLFQECAGPAESLRPSEVFHKLGERLGVRLVKLVEAQLRRYLVAPLPSGLRRELLAPGFDRGILILDVLVLAALGIQWTSPDAAACTATKSG